MEPKFECGKGIELTFNHSCSFGLNLVLHPTTYLDAVHYFVTKNSQLFLVHFLDSVMIYRRLWWNIEYYIVGIVQWREFRCHSFTSFGGYEELKASSSLLFLIIKKKISLNLITITVRCEIIHYTQYVCN